MSEVEQLRQRVRDLEATIGLADPALVVFDLSPTQRQLMGLLMRLPHVTSEMVEFRLGISTSVRVIVYHLRKKLEKHGIEIKSRHRVGYWLEPDMKGKVNMIVTAGGNDDELSA